MPAAETVIEVPVVPFDQMTVPLQSFTLKFMLVPAQTILSASFDIIVGADGFEFKDNVWIVEDKLTQEFCVHVALYVPAIFVLIVLPSAPVFQLITPEHPLAVKTVELPEQINDKPEILGRGMTVTVNLASSVERLQVPDSVEKTTEQR